MKKLLCVTVALLCGYANIFAMKFNNSAADAAMNAPRASAPRAFRPGDAPTPSHNPEYTQQLGANPYPSIQEEQEFTIGAPEQEVVFNVEKSDNADNSDDEEEPRTLSHTDTYDLLMQKVDKLTKLSQELKLEDEYGLKLNRSLTDNPNNMSDKKRARIEKKIERSSKKIAEKMTLSVQKVNFILKELLNSKHFNAINDANKTKIKELEKKYDIQNLVILAQTPGFKLELKQILNIFAYTAQRCNLLIQSIDKQNMSATVIWAGIVNAISIIIGVLNNFNCWGSVITMGTFVVSVAAIVAMWNKNRHQQSIKI